ncbi:RNA polymerase sigma factor [Ekhidna sp. To15]|uniref:RNA polymerase sigma factor n=1 Tax=Ekhidna sp. To15 TaxID=3395267 RepID=UPI003F523D14
MKVTKSFTKNDLKKLYDEYFESLRGFLYYKCSDVDVANDLVQETFIKVWNRRDDIQMETVKSLLYTVANNLLMNHFNHEKVVREHQKSANVEISSNTTSPQFQMEEAEFEKKLNQVIENLPVDCREVFLMNRIDKLKYAEIAERLGLSVKAIEKRMSKTLSIIREQLGMKI